MIKETTRPATENMGNATYPLKIFLRVITVNWVAMKIVNALPKLQEREVKGKVAEGP